MNTEKIKMRLKKLKEKAAIMAGNTLMFAAASGVIKTDEDGKLKKPVGGGEVLDYVKPDHNEGPQYIDWKLQSMFDNLPIVKLIIIGLIVLVGVLLIFRLYRVRSLRWGRGIRNEVASVTEQKTQDKIILNVNGFMYWLTRKIENSIWKMPEVEKEHRNYLLKRADILVAGFREMTAEEYNAIIKSIQLVVASVSVIFFVTGNGVIGLLLLIFGVNFVSFIPNFVIRAKVTSRNNEIKKHFPDLYLMLHYGLVMGGQEPIDKTMKSYTRTTDSPVMINFIDNCCQIIDTYGAYSAMPKISDEYKEIYEVGKMTRLISQLYGGGDVVKDLEGFRDELMESKRREIENYTNKLVFKGRTSVNIVYIILLQAILTAFSIYIKDIVGGVEVFTGK